MLDDNYPTNFLFFIADIAQVDSQKLYKHNVQLVNDSLVRFSFFYGISLEFHWSSLCFCEEKEQRSTVVSRNIKKD